MCIGLGSLGGGFRMQVVRFAIEPWESLGWVWVGVVGVCDMGRMGSHENTSEGDGTD